MKRNYLWVIEMRELSKWEPCMSIAPTKSREIADRILARCNRLGMCNYRVVKYEAVGKGETQ